ncbi:hypothetical protein DM860_004677 [Cuscuta australis]|uniref:Uncharacterized protein n=1 Tax=Cuscuta australis TaxID=267555 RepID=A0A328EA33_9ASTE|nr:hypothetical protein DM860_004677 [Cuscuta australis]
MQETNAVHQVLVKLLDGKHKTLNFPCQSVSVQALKEQIQTLTLIPAPLQLLLSSSSLCPLQDHQSLDFTTGSHQASVSRSGSSNGSGCFPVVVHVLLRLRGGKGGFGSLLRGAATKAGQKKTNNFDACRDMSGRRLRHVMAEKKMEEWLAETEERRLEKIAEDFIKKKAKELAKKGINCGSKTGESTEKYVAKYREDSERYVLEIEKSVKESLKGCLGSKRKAAGLNNKSDAKKLKIWKGKRKVDDTDSDSGDSDDSDDEKDGEDVISVVIDNGSCSHSSAEANGSENSVMFGKSDGGSSEEEKVKTGEESPEVCVTSTEVVTAQDEGQKETTPTPDQERELQLGSTSSSETIKSDNEVACNSEPVLAEEVVVAPTIQVASVCNGTSVLDAGSNSNSNVAAKEVEISVSAPEKDIIMPLNFGEINSSAELEVLGMDRLKSELQARGLKCGGTLQERASRLFLLKITPLEKLPKKLFCKK